MRQIAGILAALAICTAAARAQGPTTADARAGVDHCPVSTCGLEIENGASFNAAVRRANGESTWIGFTGASVVRAVSGVPDATAEATHGRHQLILSTVTGGIGLGALLAAVIVSSKGSQIDLYSLVGTIAVGLGGASFAAHERGVALQSFDRAAWMYNHALKRPMLTSPR